MLNYITENKVLSTKHSKKIEESNSVYVMSATEPDIRQKHTSIFKITGIETSSWREDKGEHAYQNKFYVLSCLRNNLLAQKLTKLIKKDVYCPFKTWYKQSDQQVNWSTSKRENKLSNIR